MTTNPPRQPAGPLQPGTRAPDFTLPATPDQNLTLSELASPTVLIFYPGDWSPVCSDELSMFETATGMFARHGAQLLGISVDSSWSHAAFSHDRHLSYPLLADFNPKGEVARDYGVYRDEDGTAGRALFVLDRQLQVAWSHLSPVAVSPGVDGALQAVEALS